jgi:ABC-type sugar transport system permease subunit
MGWMVPLLAAVFVVAVLIGMVAVICFALDNYKKTRLEGGALQFEVDKLNARIDSRVKSLGSSSLTLGILSLALLPLFITWPLCVVLGIVGIAQAQELYVMTKTYVAGLITSIIGVVISTFLTLMLIAGILLTV